VDTATGMANATCHCFSRQLVVEPGDRDIRTVLSQGDRNSGAYSLLRAGDQRNLPCQFHVVSLSSSG
jgi:hypothetical protein